MSQQFWIAESVPKLSLKPVTGLLAKPEFKNLVEQVLFFQQNLLMSFRLMYNLHICHARHRTGTSLS